MDWSGSFNLIFLLAISCLLKYCNASPVGAVVLLHRQLLLEGFHRELVTSVDVAFKDAAKKPCRVALIQEIPAGIYIDLDQIKSLQAWDNIQLMSPEEFNVEKPAHRSHPVSVVIYKSLNKVSSKEFNATVTLPVHLRYHSPAENDFAQVTIFNPQVLIRCEDSGDEQHTVSLACDRKSANLCKWHRATLRSDKESVTAKIPVGKSKHYSLVLVGTQVVSIFTTILLARLMCSRHVTYDESKIN